MKNNQNDECDNKSLKPNNTKIEEIKNQSQNKNNNSTTYVCDI